MDIRTQTTKNKMQQPSLCLNYDYDKNGLPLIDVIKDETADPLLKFSEQENEKVLLQKIKKELSKNEQKVFSYLLKGLNYKEIALLLDKTEKQIDNTIQRIRNKVRLLIKEE